MACHCSLNFFPTRLLLLRSSVTLLPFFRNDRIDCFWTNFYCFLFSFFDSSRQFLGNSTLIIIGNVLMFRIKQYVSGSIQVTLLSSFYEDEKNQLPVKNQLLERPTKIFLLHQNHYKTIPSTGSWR